MRHIIYIVFLFLMISSNGQNMNDTVQQLINMVNFNANLPDSCRQLLVVFNEKPAEHKAVLVVMEKNDKVWRAVLDPIKAGIGRNGFAKPGNKVEGDGKSPTGLFLLGHLFTYEKEVETKMPFTQTTGEDKWIDDPESEDYNRHIRGSTDARSYENLKLENDLYKYCMLIEYNTNPVVKGKGSAIFFHVSEDPPGSTAGCVAIPEKEMVWILGWMKPDLNPSIIMGTRQVLLSGLK